jgi:hypothetical protein
VTRKLVPGSLDAFLRDPAGSLDDVKASSKRLTVRQAVLLGLSGLYKAVVPTRERVPGLESLDFEELSCEAGAGSGL